MTGSELVPVRPVVPVRPDRPAWRARIEQATQLGIGVLGLTAREDPPRSLGVLGDTALGLALVGQRVVLDTTERALQITTRAADLASRLPGVGAAIDLSERLTQPARQRAIVVRNEAVVETRHRLPDYVGSAAGVALDVVRLDDVLARIDVDALMSRVDVNALLDRVDVNALLDRVDVDRLLRQIDMDALVGRIDVDSIVGQTDLGAVIARSTGGMATEAVDAARRQAIGLDEVFARLAARIGGRRLRDAPPGPARLIASAEDES